MCKIQRRIIAFLLLIYSISLSAGDFPADSVWLNAYLREDMQTWRELIDTQTGIEQGTKDCERLLLYQYGLCGYIVAEAKKEGNEALLPEAKRYVQQFKSQIANLKSHLPAGHYEMYLSAVYVFELRLHESIHPIKAMSLAKDATKLAPNDPLVLSYYGTCLFYAPKPFGSKKDALTWFERAHKLFRKPEWKYCWVREATMMYIQQCHEKLKK